MSNIRLIQIITVPDSLMFFKGQLNYLKDNGFDIIIISSFDNLNKDLYISDKFHCIRLSFKRDISIFDDIFSLFKLYRILKNIKPHIVHAHFPKAGFLGVFAARMARVPIVVYGMRGLRFLTLNGLKKKILWFTEWLTCHLADQIICVSNSARKRAIQEEFCKSHKIHTLGSGSGNGVDATTQFNPDRLPFGIKEMVRRQYHIPPESLVIGFVGRIVRDKGIIELEEAWRVLRQKYSNLYMLLVGRVENHDPVPQEVIKRLREDDRVIFVGWVKDTAPMYAAMDILVLPSHREGFPNTILEASSMMLPVVASNIDGCNEAVVDGKTGVLFPIYNTKRMVECISMLIEHPEIRKRMGIKGRQRVLAKFQPEKIWEQLAFLYKSFLTQK